MKWLMHNHADRVTTSGSAPPFFTGKFESLCVIFIKGANISGRYYDYDYRLSP